MRRVLLFGLLAAWGLGLRAERSPLEEAGFPKADESSHVRVASGMDYYYYAYRNFCGGAQSISLLKIAGNKFRFELALCGEKRIPPSVFGQRERALAVINAGFFEFSTPPRPAMGLKHDGREIQPIAIANRPDAGMILFRNGQMVIASAYQAEMKNLADFPAVLPTLPLLLLEGRKREFADESYLTTPQPRSAIGMAPGNTVYFLVVDGRMAPAHGMTCNDLAEIFQKLQCTVAINLDGGGSAALWLKGGGIVSYPCDNKTFDHNGERNVNDAIVVR